MKGFKVWYDPQAAQGPRMGGIGSPGGASHDPLEAPNRGYLYLLRHDVREVIDLADQSPLYIFIDDMDRCSPAVVADTIEAINLFLTKAFGPCIFIMGLDPAAVAAHLESHLPTIGQRAREDPVTYRQLRHMGWRFMEKIVDLPIRLPRVTDIAMRNYLDRLLLVNRVQHSDDAADNPQPPGLAKTTPAPAMTAKSIAATAALTNSRPYLRHTGARGGRWSRAARETTSRIPEQQTGLVMEPAVASASVLDRMEDIPVVRDALHEAVQNLPGRNPRQIKAFVNLWRFYMTLEYRLGVTTSSLTGTQVHSAEMARLVEIMVRWPWLLDPLGARRTHNGQPTNVLGVFRHAALDDHSWIQAVTGEGMNSNDEDIRELRELLCRYGGDGDELVAIAQRYL
jgi:hypothetical protein